MSKRKAPALEFYGKPDSVEVASWCPTPDATGPATQVHLLLRMGEATHVIRLKSRAAADSLIAALREHTDYVWPPGGPVEGHAATYKARGEARGYEAWDVRCACGWGVEASGAREVVEGFHRVHVEGVRTAEEARAQRHSAAKPETG